MNSHGEIVYKPSPTLRDFHKDNSFVRAILGPIGSGKSTACSVEIINRACQQRPFQGVRKSRWAVIRNTYRELNDTTIATFFSWFPKELGTFRQLDMKWNLDKPLPDSTTLELEILFRALDRPDDIKKLLSLELTGAWLNEFRELPREVFDMVQGRIGRYPSLREGGSSWFGIIADSNATDRSHWLYKVFEEDRPANFRLFKQPSGVSDEAENIANLPPDYYTNLMSGKTDEWINVYVKGLYGFITDGQPVFPEYHDDIHSTDNELAIIGNTIYVGLDFGLCYDDKTEVLTSNGWKFFDDVDVTTDLAATRNPKTGELSFTKINFKTKEPYKGKLIGWKNANVNFLVTPEHRVPFTYYNHPYEVHFTSAKDLYENHPNGKRCVDLNASWEGEQLPELPFTHQDYAQFMGWWMSDGSLDKDGRISIMQSKEHNFEDIEELLHRMQVDFGTDIRPVEHYKTSHNYRFRHSWLMDHLLEVGRLKKDRKIPSILLDAPPDILTIFLEAYIKGDGHVRYRGNESPEIKIGTGNYFLAGQLQEVALKLGYTSTLRPQKLNTGGILKDGRQITATEPFYHVMIKTSFSRASLCHKNKIEQNYDGFVYCLNVPYHTLYIRREGVPSWNGNTPAATIGQITASGQLQILEELVAENMGAMNFGRLLKEKLQKYANNPIEIFGDPAGDQRSQADETTAFQVLWAQGINAVPTYTNDFTIRREAVAEHMQRLDFAGKPAFLLSRIHAPMLRKALSGGYKYRRLQVAGQERYQDKPDKNQYSHVGDALQYLVLGAVGGERVIGGFKNITKIDYSEINKRIV